MKDRKYPASLFISGMIFNMIKRWYIIAVSALLFIIRIFVPALSILLPIAILLLGIVIAFMEQLAIRNTAMKSEHEAFDKIFNENGSSDWQSNAINMVHEKLKEQNDIDGTKK